MRYNINTQNIQGYVDTNRFDKQYREAHKRLNMLVVGDSTPFIPFQQGQLREQVRYPDGIYGDVVEWYAPYAHYQYYGTLYTDELGRAYVGEGEVKTVNTGIPLNYSEPGTGDHWFENAKNQYKSQWIKEIRRIAGGGNA